MAATSPPPPERRPMPAGGLLHAPAWLRELGVSSWYVVGIALVAVAGVWLLSLTQTIAMPVITASVVAAVASPVVRWLQRHRIPRAAGAGIVLLAAVALIVLVLVLVLGGILSQSSDLSAHLEDAKDKLGDALHSAGVDDDRVASAKEDMSDAATKLVPALLEGVVGGIAKISSLVFFLALTVLSLFFLLKDGPQIRAWTERHMGFPPDVGHLVVGRMLQSLRGYFFGVTIVAAFNAVVVGLGALLLGVPLVGTIAIVTFLGAYIPYLGAWTAGIFAVLVALGGAGTDAAIGMAIVQLLANGILQQLVQPIAYGAALGIHPLAVLIVTIGGGALFGTVGLVLAAPVVSAATRLAGDMAERRAAVGGPVPGPEAPA